MAYWKDKWRQWRNRGTVIVISVGAIVACSVLLGVLMNRQFGTDTAGPALPSVSPDFNGSAFMIGKFERSDERDAAETDNAAFLEGELSNIPTGYTKAWITYRSDDGTFYAFADDWIEIEAPSVTQHIAKIVMVVNPPQSAGLKIVIVTSEAHQQIMRSPTYPDQSDVKVFQLPKGAHVLHNSNGEIGKLPEATGKPVR